MNDAQTAAQGMAAAGSAGKAASLAAVKYTALGLIIGAVSCISVIMAATAPSGKRNLFMCIMSTALASLCGGNYVGKHFGFVDAIVSSAMLGDMSGVSTAVYTLIGIAFVCGLPAWCLIGGVFVWFERMRGKTIIEILADAKSLWK
jgi:uncharacterized membrane protein YuzA (DUF378 family)